MTKLGYKMTEIGEIPEEWRVVRIGEILNMKRGYSYSGNEITRESSTNIRIININDFDKESGWKKPAEPLYLQSSSLPKRFQLKESDLVIANTDMSKGLIIGSPLLIDSIDDDLSFIFSSDLTKLSPVGEELDTKFLYYYFSGNNYRSIVLTFAQGTNVLHLNHDLYKRLQIVVPPLNEQQKITDILSTADEAIQKVNEEITLTEKLKKGLMQTLLTKGIGHTKFKMTEIGEIPEEWKLVEIGDNKVSELIMGQSPPSSSYNTSGKGIPFLQGNADFGQIYPTPRIYCTKPLKVAEKGDILLSVRAPVGELNIAAFKCVIGRGLAAIRCKDNKTDCKYLYYYLKYSVNRLRSMSTGSTFKAVGKDILSHFEICLPDYEEQQKIAEILTTVDYKLELLRNKKTYLERIKKGLMNDLLTGKVRVNINTSEGEN